MTADRAMTPVVGKAVEVGLVVAYVALLSATLYGSVVPDYRTTTGDAVGERVLSTATQRVQQAVPPRAHAARATARVTLPRTIRGRSYVVRVDGRSLVLVHPHPGIGGRQRLALPSSVAGVRGEWRSTEPAVVRVQSGPDGMIIVLTEGAT